MKQYRNAQEIQAELGTQSLGGIQSCPEGNAARMGMLGLGASGPGRESQAHAQEGPEAGPAMEGPSGEQGAGPPGEMEALHGSDGHGLMGGDTEVQVGPHHLDTGQVNLLVDYVPSLEALMEISPEDLVVGLGLIEKMELHGLSPEETEDFDRIFPDYADIGLDNSDHFAPPSDGLAPAGSPNFLGQIREHLGKAHEQATSGDLNGALVTAGWGGHYIADAFSAGHMVNKDEIMATADTNLKGNAAATFAVAADHIMANGQEQLSTWRQRTPLGLAPIDAPLLRRLYALTNVYMHSAITGAITKAIHDELSGDPGRPIVEVSSMGETWLMGGDGNLDETSERIGKDIIQWVYDALAGQAESSNFIKADAMIGWVEKHLPKPTTDGQATIDGIVSRVFESNESIGHALGTATLSEFDAVMAKFGLLVEQVEGGGGDQISDYPEPELREILEGENITDNDVEEALERLKGGHDDHETILSDYGLSVDELLDGLREAG